MRRCCPTRSCRKKTGPFDVSLIAAATNGTSHGKTHSAAVEAKKTSTARLAQPALVRDAAVPKTASAFCSSYIEMLRVVPTNHIRFPASRGEEFEGAGRDTGTGTRDP